MLVAPAPQVAAAEAAAMPLNCKTPERLSAVCANPLAKAVDFTTPLSVKADWLAAATSSLAEVELCKLLTETLFVAICATVDAKLMPSRLAKAVIRAETRPVEETVAATVAPICEAVAARLAADTTDAAPTVAVQLDPIVATVCPTAEICGLAADKVAAVETVAVTAESWGKAAPIKLAEA